MLITDWLSIPVMTRAELDLIHHHVIDKITSLAGHGFTAEEIHEVPVYIIVVLDDPAPQPTAEYLLEQFEGWTLATTMIHPEDIANRYSIVRDLGRNFPYRDFKAVLSASLADLTVLTPTSEEKIEVLSVADMPRGGLENARMSNIPLQECHKKNILIQAKPNLLVQFLIGLVGRLSDSGYLELPASAELDKFIKSKE